MGDTTPKTTSADNDASHTNTDMDDLPDSDASEAVITGSGSTDKPYNNK